MCHTSLLPWQQNGSIEVAEGQTSCWFLWRQLGTAGHSTVPRICVASQRTQDKDGQQLNSCVLLRRERRARRERKDSGDFLAGSKRNVCSVGPSAVLQYNLIDIINQ